MFSLVSWYEHAYVTNFIVFVFLYLADAKRSVQISESVNGVASRGTWGYEYTAVMHSAFGQHPTLVVTELCKLFFRDAWF
jgi:hypothetical protein